MITSPTNVAVGATNALACDARRRPSKENNGTGRDPSVVSLALGSEKCSRHRQRPGRGRANGSEPGSVGELPTMHEHPAVVVAAPVMRLAASAGPVLHRADGKVSSTRTGSAGGSRPASA